MAYNYDRSDAGTSGYRYVDSNGNLLRYGPGRWNLMHLWLPDDVVANPPPWKCFVWVHGGGLTSPFTSTTSNSGGGYASPNAGIGSKITSAIGAVYVSIEFSPGGGGTKATQYTPCGYLPQQFFEVARAVQFLRDHADDAEVWGSGGSIQDDIVTGGESQGGINALTAALMPEGFIRKSGEQSTRKGWANQWHSMASHKPAAVYNDEGMVDISQAGSGISSLGTFFSGASAPWATYDKIPRQHWKAASAWFWLKAALRDNNALKFLTTFQSVTSSGWTWNPGTPDNNIVDPHEDKPQAQEWHNEMVAQEFANSDGTGDSETWWGNTGEGQTNGAQVLQGNTKADLVEDWLNNKVWV